MAQKSIRFIVPDRDGIGGGPSPVIISVPYLSQTVSNWCWATCATMVARYYGYAINICKAASMLMVGNDCCLNAPSEGTYDPSWNNGNCNRTCTVAEVGQLYANMGFSYTDANTSISFDDLTKEIAERLQPVEVAYRWRGGGGHVAIVMGVDSDTQSVHVNDPWPDYGQTVTSYVGLTNAYGKGNWFHTWSGIARLGG